MDTLRDIIGLARAQAPFYSRLYRDLPRDLSLAQLPLIDVDDYWAAHREDRTQILTGPLTNGIVLNSGGTTGLPKFSYYDDAEWDVIVALSARAYTATGLQDGDRVANLFAGGDLYSSFLFATQSLKAATPGVLQFPIGHSMNFASAAAAVQGFQTNVLAGFPTHLLRVINYLDEHLPDSYDVRRILFAGESFSADQEAFLHGRFPGVSIRSVGYATIDAGLIGYADDSCGIGEHRVFDGATLVEIVDEATEEVIEAARRPGRVVFTSCTRRVMPMLRYPTGDRGEWIDETGVADRRFRLMGRCQEAARVASFSLQLDRVKSLLAPFAGPLGIRGFQLMVTREADLRDQLTLRLVGDEAAVPLAAGNDEILAEFAVQQPELNASVVAGIMHPPKVEWIVEQDLILNQRTGKLQMIVDRRMNRET